MRTLRKKHLIPVLACTGLVLLLVLGTPAFIDLWILRVPFDPVPFDSQTWKQTPSEFSLQSVRLRMANDLVSTHLRDGMTREEVVGMLGEPDETPYFAEYDMVYHLGQERHPFGIDSEWLVIRLDANRQAAEILLVTD